MTPIKAKRHPESKPRGVRDPRTCKAQAGGTMAWIEDGQPLFWTDRPFKFPGAIKSRLTWFAKHGRTVKIEDLKWKQIGSATWWRIPDFPDGVN